MTLIHECEYMNFEMDKQLPNTVHREFFIGLNAERRAGESF